MLQSMGSKRVGHDLVTEQHKKCREQGRAWEFPGGPVARTLLSLQRAQVCSLVGELRSHKRLDAAKI